MRLRFARLRTVLTYVGHILFVFGLLLVIPFLQCLFLRARGEAETGVLTFAVPIAVSLLLGAACRWQMQHGRHRRPVGTQEAMAICVLGWVVVSAVGALPFSLGLHVSYLDAYFEAMSGFTTTGITMLTGLDDMPRSILFWRSMTQWIGGLGILTFFLAVVFEGGLSHRLFGAESHKIKGKRMMPGMWNTLKILWLVYILLTAVIIGALYTCGISLYDAVSHALTCISTGGYSPYDASIAYYEQAGQAHHVAIEYIVIVGMWAGGTNFLVHFRLLRGQLRALWDSTEIRAWWALLIASLLIVWIARVCSMAGDSAGDSFRHSLFQVVAVATTTGYATRDIAGDYFAPIARQVFLVLMLIGGCAGSTGGGIKVIRIVILWKLLVRQVRRTLKPESSIELLLVDGGKVDQDEAYRTASLFFAWIVLLLFGALTTAALSTYGAEESASGMFSALGNIGPCYITVDQMTQIHPATKIVYIVGMLAGRLEIIPVLALFGKRAWQ